MSIRLRFWQILITVWFPLSLLLKESVRQTVFWWLFERAYVRSQQDSADSYQAVMDRIDYLMEGKDLR